MGEIALAKKYAKALFEIARKEKIEDIVYGDLSSVLAIIESDESFKKIWFDRRISKIDKKALLNKLFGLINQTTTTGTNQNVGVQFIEPLSQRFIELLIRKRRENIFSYIVDHYYQNFAESRNILAAEICSAFELEEREIKMLKDKLLEFTGAKELKLNFNVNKSLIGGLLVRIKDEIFDGTVLNKLNKLRERVAG